MGIFSKKRSLEDLYADEEYFREEGTVNDLKAQSLERQRVIKELEREYGPGWKKLLGLSGKSNIDTLKSFLRGFKTKSKELHVAGGAATSNIPSIRTGTGTGTGIGSSVPRLTEGVRSPIAKVQGIE